MAACRERIRAITDDLRWRACLEPLVTFCASAHRAPDLACPDLDPDASLSRLPAGRKRDVQIALSYLRAGSPGQVVKKGVQRVRSRLT
jgi:hypothetical protein